MFTGLIEEIGVLRRVQKRGEAMILTIAAKKVLEDVKLGNSISVNGVCLTVVSYDGGSFNADVMPQTFRHSNLCELKPGNPVNLERAMMADGLAAISSKATRTGRARSRIAERMRTRSCSRLSRMTQARCARSCRKAPSRWTASA